MTLEPCLCFRCCDPDCPAVHSTTREDCEGCCGYFCTQCVHWDCVIDECIFPRVADIYKLEGINHE